MKEYPPEKIRNVAVIGHGSTGKTSLAEGMLFATGVTTRLGRVEDGTTVSDWIRTSRSGGSASTFR